LDAGLKTNLTVVIVNERLTFLASHAACASRFGRKPGRGWVPERGPLNPASSYIIGLNKSYILTGGKYA